MGIKDYFSNDSHKRALFIFDFIAPLYSHADFWLLKKYRKVLPLFNKDISLDGFTILDVGCGTGAWISQFQSFNPKKLTGVDLSEKMIKIANNKYPNIEFKHTKIGDIKTIPSQSVDIVTSSYVLHGMKENERESFLIEMKRIARKAVVIHDFYGKTEFFIQIIEFFERSDYKFFKKNFHNEMNKIFINSKIIDTTFGTALYIGEV